MEEQVNLKFPEGIYDGLQIPKKVKPLHEKAKKIVVKKVMTDEEILAKKGTYIDEKGMRILDEDCDVYGVQDDGSEKLIAKLRKQVIDPELVKIGWEGYWITAAASRNRGAAAGPINVKGKYWAKRKPTEIKGWSARYMQDGKVSKMRVNNNVFSSVLGYFEETPFMKVPCRLTSYTMRYFKNYKHGLPYIKAINECFKKLNPDEYSKQFAAAKKQPLLHIEDTAFSSITINRNFRTALHQDDGDFKQGFGNLSVIERGKYHGGYTLFPQYGVGFNLRSGDYIAMDVHQMHCNTELYETPEDKKFNKDLKNIYKDSEESGTLGSDKPFTRISFVCYLREKIPHCKPSETRKYFKKIGFNPKTMTLAKQTRKKKATQADE